MRLLLLWPRLSLLLLLFLLSLTCNAAAAADASSTDEDDVSSNINENEEGGGGPNVKQKQLRAQQQIEWLRSRGGYVHPSLSVQPIFPDDDHSPLGIFTSTPLRKKEPVIILTPNCLFRSDSGTTCDTVHKLVEHRKLGDKSEYAPYVQHVVDPQHRGGDLPSAFSNAGKRLLRTIVGQELPPQALTTMSSRDVCDYDDDDEDEEEELDPLFEETYFVVLRRSWDDKMLPVFDMINHRNGKQWTNIHSTSAHAPGGANITVFATRDIAAGEQLYQSYNQCQDCRHFAMSYGLPEMVRDFGFVEEYPRRFVFKWPGDEDGNGDVPPARLDLHQVVVKNPDDDDNSSEQLQLTWRSPKNRMWELFFRGHLRRLYNLHDDVRKQAADLNSHERWLSLAYYDALVEVLEYAVGDFRADDGDNGNSDFFADDIDEESDNDDDDDDDDAVVNDDDDADAVVDDNEQQEECSVSETGEQVCRQAEQTQPSPPSSSPSSTKNNVSASTAYDELNDVGRKIYNNHMCNTYFDEDAFEDVEYFESQHQSIHFQYNPTSHETCLRLNNHLQACSSFRPHYHEVFVHAPAQYVDRVRRVAFIGGGDNMIVHEILKYPDLELAVGLELDHHVVRSSFNHFGTQPHWDDSRLQWWFGDGAKSLLMLPEEYFGSFDLVLLDLQTEVAEILKVTDNLNVMQAAMLLLKPDGVIARNEDWEFGTSNPFTEYAVDLYYVDVPTICVQGITMGSNSVDFLKHKPNDHGIDSVYFGPFVKKNGPFTFWYNYLHQSANCKEASDDSATDKKSSLAGAIAEQAGALMILEVENAQKLDTPEAVQAAMSKALKFARLTELSVAQSATTREKAEDDDGTYEIIFVLEEGIVAARIWPALKYCALDVLLWGKIENQEAAKAALISAVGGKLGKTTSSFRLVTTGINGGTGSSIGSSKVSDACKEEAASDARNASAAKKNDLHAALEVGSALLFPKSSNAPILVLCGRESLGCGSLDLLTKKFADRKVVSIWACPDLETDMSACQSNTLDSLTALGAEAQGKLGGIVIDSTVPRQMGQIVHKVLSSRKLRTSLFKDNIVVLSTALDATTASWQRAFLDRFRTVFVKWDPAYRLEAAFNGTKSNNFELGVFSSGDDDFYSHALNLVTSIEKKTGLVSDVRHIVNGVNGYRAEFEPSKTSTPADYDFSRALEQWESQRQLGEQAIIQFAKIPASPGSLSSAQITKAVQAAAREVQDASTGQKTDLDAKSVKVGSGSVDIVFLAMGGSIITTWDGDDRITAYFFADNAEEGNGRRPDHFSALLRRNIVGLEFASRDDLPRGIGRTVNYMENLPPKDAPLEARPAWVQSVSGTAS